MELEQRTCYSGAKRTSLFMGITMLVYYMLLNIAVTTVCVVDTIFSLLPTFFNDPELFRSLPFEALTALVTETLATSMFSNYWGYIIAIGAGILILLLWKKKTFWKQEIWARNRKMTAGRFFLLLLFTVGVQAIPQILMPIAEFFLNKIGLSVMASVELASISGDSLSLFLYAGFIGPFAEEILFRGLLLRSFNPYGKQFAMFASAFLFAMFHGNIVQIPFAFAMGLLFGYIAVEYSIFWAIIYHVFNNFVLADLLSRVTEVLSDNLAEGTALTLIYGCAFGAVTVGIIRRKDVKAYFKENPMNGLSIRAFFTAPTILIFSIMMVLSSIMLLFI